jgi:hypothetical protein
MAMASIVLGADARPSPSVEPKAVCEKFLLYILQGKTSEAFAVSRAAGGRGGDDLQWSDLVSSTHAQLIEVKHKYGEPLGWELVREYRVNETLRRYVYLFKYDSGVLHWEFVFYRPRNDWRLTAVHFDATLDALWSSSPPVAGQSQDSASSDHHP